jgi:protein-S-isoprenylcysteine O-methyltransferase Ste14
VAWNTKWALPYLLFYCLFQAPRIRKEDAVLEQAFGETFRRYKARTWF